MEETDKLKQIWRCILLVAATWVLAADVPVYAADNVTYIEGTVLATEIDEDGNPLSISIITKDDEYVVSDSDAGRKLFRYVNRRVRVRGTVRSDGEGNLVITVASFEVMEGSSDGTVQSTCFPPLTRNYRKQHKEPAVNAARF
ncbi:MAG: Ig-like domain-containing protein [Candidatus Moduliflexus flocculans]|nr:Ig-like domain-containing protein [Candidatus Moduliflexus flocculans]